MGQRKPGFARATTLLLAPIAIGAMLVLASCQDTPATSTNGAVEDLTGDELVAAAQKDGRLVWYTNLISQQAEWVVDAFGEEYGIPIEVVRKLSTQHVEQLTIERAGDRIQADIVDHGGGPPPFHTILIPAGIVSEYSPTGAEHYPAELSVEGYAHPVTTYTFGVTYNPDRVTPEEIELLKDYDNWTDPRFADRIAITAPTGGTTGSNMHFMRLELGEDFLEGLAELDPVVYNGSANTLNAVATGAQDIGINTIPASAAQLTATGARIEGIYVDGPTMSVPTLLAVVEDGPHPYAARLFVDWFLSPAVQERFSTEESLVPSLRDDVETPGLASAPVMWAPDDWVTFYEGIADTAAYFEEVFQ